MNPIKIYARIVAKSGVKMKALIAVQRKMLELIFVIDKNKTRFENDYQQKRTPNANAESILLQTFMYMSCGVSRHEPLQIKTGFGKSAGFSKCGLTKP